MKKLKKLLLLLSVILLAAAQAWSSDAIPGTKVVFLNEPELAALGIKIVKGNVEFYDVRADSKNKKTQKVVITQEKIDVKNAKKSEIKGLPKVSPRLAVTVSGYGSAAYFSRIEDFLGGSDNATSAVYASKCAQINNLVAIRIRPDIFSNDVFLWYEPTKEFLNALPQHFRQDVQKDIKDNPDKSSSYINPPPKDLFSDIYIYPNPAVGARTNLTFKINESRSFNIAVYDLTGRMVKNAQENVFIDKGDYKTQIDLEGIPAGMYVIAIITNKGEKAVERVVVL